MEANDKRRDISRYRGLKVAFVCLDDAANPRMASGGPACIRRAFQSLGCDVVDIFPVAPRIGYTFLPKKALYRLAGYYYHCEREPRYLRQVARHVERAVAQAKPDLVYVVQPLACSELSGRLGAPVAMCHDQTFIERMTYFPFEQRPPAGRYVHQSMEQEGKAFANIDLIVYPSQRSIATVRSAYGVPDERLAMVPWGGNLPSAPDAEEVAAMIAARAPSPVNLSFIGVDWKRKGGDIAIGALRALRARGVDARLTVMGTTPTDLAEDAVTVIPFINKNDPQDFRRLWDILAQTHLFLVPSRVEAFGHVFAEAAAFGVPAIATDVGGIPSSIDDRVNGRLLPLDAGGPAYAEAIAEVMADPETYRAMATATRRRYEQDLNWEAFCSTVIDRALERRRPMVKAA